ncbi:MAG TPA: hypothetical protein VGQ99_02330 [Tepidisphaeraceae bacterium]|jgi:ElaB/YqjD/DUF883 family membrane-anchored ribosome-binding protein|nr:hypothetical protein [Tepidisphaeraceae bacterium]
MSRLDNPSNQGGSQAGAIGQIKDKAQEAKEKLREMGSAASEQVNQLKESANEYYQQGREKAQEYYEQGRQKAMEMEQNLEAYVREQPLKAVMIAAGVGLLLGILWRRS